MGRVGDQASCALSLAAMAGEMGRKPVSFGVAVVFIRSEHL